MNSQTKVTGVILAGGLARRMNNQDKGLIHYKGRPMVSYAIAAITAIADQTIINANRNREQYEEFGLPVVADQTGNFDGPLAGILTAMINTDADVLVVMPCDSPLIKAEHLQKLLATRAENDADVAVAFDGKRLHPVFLAIKTALKTSLQDYLASGQRKIGSWLRQQNMVKADFSNEPEIFTNINTLTELSELEAKKANRPMHIGRTISSVQTPIIPVISELTRNTPGTLSLGQGMVSYPPPVAALQAIRDFGTRPEEHLYGSPLGYGRLLELIETKLLSENNIDCTSGYRVMVTAGSNMAFLNVLLAIADPGGGGGGPLPYYFNQEMAVRMLNCKPVPVPTDAGYQLQIDTLRAAITDKTRAIVTVSPNNPSGAVYPEADLRAVNQLCKEHGLYHISDEAYEYFTYGEARHFSPGRISGAEQHTISLYSLSKAYGFASWRVGYLVIPETLLPSLLKVQDTNLICPPLITQYAAIGALETGSSYCKTQLQMLAKIHAQVTAQLQCLSGVQIAATEGAFYLLLKLDTGKNDLQLVKSLISEFKVAVIPGCAFGLNDACYLRVSYGMLHEETADIATQRLVEGLGKLC